MLKYLFMKRNLLMGIAGVAALLMVSCQKQVNLPEAEDAISELELSQIRALGFGTTGVQRHEDGFLVEGDIVITPDMLGQKQEEKFLRVAESEQYRTTNVVTRLPRVISIRVATSLPSGYVTATNEAIARFNAENLRISFRRVTSGGNIVISKAPNGATYLASAGFPTSTGNPFNSIKVNTTGIGSQPVATVATILAHEIGHCIGFRHTDYMSRQYSCGGSPVNEGASTVGAILIPGTPSGPDPNSWMLACIGGGQNRPFNANDKVALAFVY